MNEELLQRGYYKNGSIIGDTYGKFEKFDLGATSVAEIESIGLIPSVPTTVCFPFQSYKPPKNPRSTKPDAVFCSRIQEKLQVVAIKENKSPSNFNTEKKKKEAFEQGLYAAALVGARVAIVTDETKFFYIDVSASLQNQDIVLLPEKMSLNPGLLEEILRPNRNVTLDPSPLAEKAWQAIWHATKEEPKACLLTFVEIFVLKFLSDNLSHAVLAKSYSFYELSDTDPEEFKKKYGKTQIEYYVQVIRSEIKRLFPDKTPIANQEILGLLGLGTIVSSTSIINGFAFLRSGATNLETFNRTFVEILGYFKDFGPLSHIDPEFKTRLYETFLKKSSRQQKLGQFFTPRNVVKAIIGMARLDKLKEGDLVLDPAAGVGGFILEPLNESTDISQNISFEKGVPKQRIRFLGLDVDPIMHMLAKTNTLIHLAEAVRNPSVTIDALNQLMAELFLILEENSILGSLQFPVQSKASVIMTNPPYVTQGSRIYRDEILKIKKLCNGVDLKDYYDRCGLGLESLFLRYISGALKPGGRAFVIVPHGMLTRSESAMKEKILGECNLLASIALPRNTFFNTSQKTYILVLEKRHAESDQRPKVFCAIASSIGESLDARRIPTPDDNTLQEIAQAFVDWDDNKPVSPNISKRIKTIDSWEFDAFHRWDILRFWDENEQIAIGERTEAVETSEFVVETKDALQELLAELETVERDLQSFNEGPFKTFPLADERLFKIRRGKRVTREDCEKNKGQIPVYSGSKFRDKTLGSVSEEFARKRNLRIENDLKSDKPIVTINANGAVGCVFTRREKCIIHDDVMVVEILSDKLDVDYVEIALRKAIAAGHFEYGAKLYGRVKQLEIEIPVDENEEIDLSKQNSIAKMQKCLDSTVQRLKELGMHAAQVRLN